VTLAFAVLASVPGEALRVEVLRSIGGLPAHIAGSFQEAIGFQQGPDGYYVFDRRAHAVYAVDAAKTTARTVVDIGQEDGRVIQPKGFDVARDGRLVIADAPRGRQRIQMFDAAGTRLSGFYLQGQPSARVISVDNLMLNGTGSVQFAGTRLLLSHPESGALVTAYTPAGYPTDAFGQLRPTPFESDRELHLAHNAGLPLADPTGGFYFVFVTGRPVFRKYSERGQLLFERHIEGVEFDALLDAQPTSWPRRRVEDREVPFVAPVIRAAAVSPLGELWISLGVPYTYVYDAQGDKIRTVQFTGAGTVSPTSLAFGQNGTLLVTPGCYEFQVR
jgi:hypothetical protein